MRPKRRYQVVRGTSYHVNTPREVVAILERARKERDRIKIWYGDVDTGRPWSEECYPDEVGYVSRSLGGTQIPLSVYCTRSMGGTPIMDHCIVRIRPANKKYQPYCYMYDAVPVRKTRRLRIGHESQNQDQGQAQLR